MQTLLIIGQNNSYTQELKRAAMYKKIEVVSTCSCLEDLQQFLQTGIRVDIIVASDNLFQTNVPKVVSALFAAGYHDNVFFILKHPDFQEYLYRSNVQYAFETDMAPTVLLDMIQRQIPDTTEEPQYQENYSYHQPRYEEEPRYNQGYPNQPQQQNGFQNQYRNYTENEYFNMMNQRSGFKPMMITINSPKGGVGKTSLSIELSSMLANRANQIDINPNSRLHSARKIEVCLVDLNPSFDTMASSLKFVRDQPTYPTVTDWVSAIEEKIYNELDAEDRIQLRQDKYHNFVPFLPKVNISFSREEIRRLVLHDDQTGLYVVPSVSLPFDVEYVKPEYLRIILQQLRRTFDIVIVDTGNNVSFFTVEALQQADEVFLVTAPTTGSTTVLGKLTKNLERLRLSRDKINLIINYPNGAESELSPERIAEALQLPLVSVLPFDEGIRSSHEMGEPYAIHNPKSTYAQAIVKLAVQICPLWNTSLPKARKPKKKKKKGFFSFLFN